MTNLRSPEGAVLHLPGSPSGRRSAGGGRSVTDPAALPDDPPVVALLLHGGVGEPDRRRVPAWWPPVLRMIAVGLALRHHSRGPVRTSGATRSWRRLAPTAAEGSGRPAKPIVPVITRLRYRARGWNADGAEPISDARWALGRLRHHFPGSPIVLVGHSMGGRVGAALLADPDVIGLVGLAPWVPPGEPVPDLTDRRVVLIHGSRDRQIPPDQSTGWASQANAGRTDTGSPTAATCEATMDLPVTVIDICGGGHAMLRHWRRWHRLTGRALNQLTASRSRQGPPGG